MKIKKFKITIECNCGTIFTFDINPQITEVKCPFCEKKCDKKNLKIEMGGKI